MSSHKNNGKRQRAATNPIEQTHQKSDEQFIAENLQPSEEWTEWMHPKTQQKYTVSLAQAGSMSPEDLKACFDLVEETSKADYEASSGGWKPKKKSAEMRSPELRYIIVKDGQGNIRGFTSLMPTFEEGQPVVYCYEIHLKPELQGTGLGRLLMGFHDKVALHTPTINKVMLTCFLSNKRGLNFYNKLGFVKDDISPEPRKLRFGKEFIPDYVIMSKKIDFQTLKRGRT